MIVRRAVWLLVAAVTIAGSLVLGSSPARAGDREELSHR